MNQLPGMAEEFRTIDHVTGEMHVFRGGRNLSVESGAPDPGLVIPQGVINAAIVAAMLEHPRRDAGRWGYVGCDMTPVVLDAGPAANTYGTSDVWWVLLQYSTTGAQASYGVDRNNVPQCYAD